MNWVEFVKDARQIPAMPRLKWGSNKFVPSRFYKKSEGTLGRIVEKEEVEK